MLAYVSRLFFFNATATTEIYTLSLHDALPISDSWPALHCLQKPFGVHELRRKLASILTVG